MLGFKLIHVSLRTPCRHKYALGTWPLDWTPYWPRAQRTWRRGREPVYVALSLCVCLWRGVRWGWGSDHTTCGITTHGIQSKCTREACLFQCKSSAMALLSDAINGSGDAECHDFFLAITNPTCNAVFK